MKKITRIDNGDGKESQHDIEEARDRIEGAGYYKKGTIDECIELFKRGQLDRSRPSHIGEDFTLRTPWAHWKFEL